MNLFRSLAVIVVVFIAVAVTGPTAAAQGFGIKGGAVFPDFSSDVFDIDNNIGTELGVFFGGNRPGVVGIQGEVNWIRKKAETGGTNIRLDYLQAAGLLRINLGTRSTSGFAIYGLAGPGFDFKIGDEIEGFEIEDAFEDFDIGLIFGGGVEISRILFEGRYQRGLKNINNNFTDIDEIKSHSFSVLIGFRFN